MAASGAELATDRSSGSNRKLLPKLPLATATKPGRASRRLHAGCCSGSIRASPELIPEEGSPPVLTSPNPLSTLLQRVRLRSPLSTVPAEILSRRFRNAHHRGFCPQQLAVARDLHLTAGLEGPSFISRTVPHLLRRRRVRDTRPFPDLASIRCCAGWMADLGRAETPMTFGFKKWRARTNLAAAPERSSYLI